MSWPEAILAIIVVLCVTIILIAWMATREGNRERTRQNNPEQFRGGRLEE